jgi:hypothetical protein
MLMFETYLGWTLVLMARSIELSVIIYLLHVRPSVTASMLHFSYDPVYVHATSLMNWTRGFCSKHCIVHVDVGPNMLVIHICV